MKVYYFDEVTGVLLGEGESYSVPDGATDIPPSSDDYLFLNGEWVAPPAKTLEELKSEKESEIVSARKAEEKQGVVIDGVRYAGDAENRQTLEEAVRFAQATNLTTFQIWKDSDNSYHANHPVSKVSDAIMMIAQHRNLLIAKEAPKVAEIEAAKTFEEVDKVTW